MYFAITFINSVVAYCVWFTNPSLKIQDMTPAWDLPIFPFMLSATIAAAGAHQAVSSGGVDDCGKHNRARVGHISEYTHVCELSEEDGAVLFPEGGE